MAKLKAIAGGKGKEKAFSLVYGLRLYPSGQVTQVTEGGTVLRDGTPGQVPLHLIEGSREQIRVQLLASIEAFFEIYTDEAVERTAPACSQDEEMGETGC